MIKVIELEKKFPGFHLQKISFEIKKGEIFALLGPNGAGKTTTIRIILGLIKRYEGKVVREKNIKIGFVLENETPFENLYPTQYLQFFTRINGGEKRIEDVLRWLKLEKHINKLNSKLSKGMKKKLCLAKSIINEPDLLILDEPFEGIEPETRAEIREFLKSYAQKDKTILITSHELYEVEDLCTSFGIIYEGKFLGKWDIKEIKKENKSLYEFYINIIRNGKI